MSKEDYAEARRRFEAKLRMPIPWASVPVVVVPITEELAEKIAKNPGSVRVIVRGEVTKIERPRDNFQGVSVHVDRVRPDAEHPRIWGWVGANGIEHRSDPISRKYGTKK